MLQLSLTQMFTVARRRRENKQCSYWGLSHVTRLCCYLVSSGTLRFASFCVYIFFFSHLVFSEEDFTGEEEMPSFRGERPPAKHIHKHTTDGVSGTCQDVKWFCMLVGWCLKWQWGTLLKYLWNSVTIPLMIISFLPQLMRPSAKRLSVLM